MTPVQSQPSPTLFLSVGDLSGDNHCAALVAELLHRHPEWKITALGGRGVAQAGAEILGDTTGMGVIGFAAALQMVPRSLAFKRRALAWIANNRPAVAILCDWGGFNGRILAELQQMGVPVVYYFPPRSWQKTGEGGLSIVPFCQRIATPFEWSQKRLEEAGGNATWVGHPILERVHALPPRDQLRTQFGVASGQKLLVALPGSRALELRCIASHVAQSCAQLAGSNLKIAVAATTGARARLQALFGPEVSVIEGQTLELLRAADAAIVKSGTSTLEAALVDVPQVVVYDVPPLLRAQVSLTGLKRKIRFVAMPNIIAEREIVPELLGEKCRPAHIVPAVSELLEDGSRSAHMRQDYDEVRAALGEGLPYTATSKTADLIEELVFSRHHARNSTV
jgi:lipid-A-disaccharide synthase